MNYDAKIDVAEEQDDQGLTAPDDAEREGPALDRRLLIGAGIALAALIAIWFMTRTSEPGVTGEGIIGQAPAVSVVIPGKSSITGLIEATGTLAARRELPVGVVGEGGQVERVLVEPGEWVKAGQVLAVIDRSVQTQQQASLAAQVQVAQADARLAQSNLDRALKLVDRGFISKADVDRLTATRDAAEARVGIARAQLAEMRARTRRLDIVAPEAGLVLKRNVEPGQVVGPASGVLFSLAKGGEMEMLADLSETDLAKISQGVSAQVTPVGSDKSFSGQVWQVSPVVDPQDRQGSARIALSYAPDLRPGGFATARISSGGFDAPKLPESAVLSDDDGSYVYVVGDDGKVSRRNVETGKITSDGIAILEGLSGSEKVVLRAGAFLSPGETVKIKLVKSS